MKNTWQKDLQKNKDCCYQSTKLLFSAHFTVWPTAVQSSSTSLNKLGKGWKALQAIHRGPVVGMNSDGTGVSYLVDVIPGSVEHYRPNQHLCENIGFRYPPAENIGTVWRILGVILRTDRKAQSHGISPSGRDSQGSSLSNSLLLTGLPKTLSMCPEAAVAGGFPLLRQELLLSRATTHTCSTLYRQC